MLLFPRNQMPCLPTTLFYRAYRGTWHSTDVCVKILNLFAPLSPTGSTNSDAGFPAAPLLEAALSKALLHPNIVGVCDGGCGHVCLLSCT